MKTVSVREVVAELVRGGRKSLPDPSFGGAQLVLSKGTENAVAYLHVTTDPCDDSSENVYIELFVNGAKVGECKNLRTGGTNEQIVNIAGFLRAGGNDVRVAGTAMNVPVILGVRFYAAPAFRLTHDGVVVVDKRYEATNPQIVKFDENYPVVVD